MFYPIKNWKLALLALVFFCLFISLGCWQLSRASEKRILLKSFTIRAQQPPLSVNQLKLVENLRFHRAKLVGYFDNAHTILLDNKTHQNKIGYEVYTPFNVNGLATPILVDRGFIPLTGTRDKLPTIAPIADEIMITGLLNHPPLYKALGEMVDNGKSGWPLRLEYIDLSKIAKLLNTPLYPYILTLADKNPAAFNVEWKIVMMAPERHEAYALQWFAFALVLLLLFAALNRRGT